MLLRMVDHQPELDAAKHWAVHADEWSRWAREPDLDAYCSFRTAFREFVPAPGVSTLEIGCGEGRISRDLTALGHRVTATDITPSLFAAAVTVSSGSAVGRPGVASRRLASAVRWYAGSIDFLAVA